MAIDPDLYEKVTGRSLGEAQSRLGESLARQERDRQRSEEERSYVRTWLLFGWEGVVLHYVLERWGYFAVFAALVVTVFLIWFFAF